MLLHENNLRRMKLRDSHVPFSVTFLATGNTVIDVFEFCGSASCFVCIFASLKFEGFYS